MVPLREATNRQRRGSEMECESESMDFDRLSRKREKGVSPYIGLFLQDITISPAAWREVPRHVTGSHDNLDAAAHSAAVAA